MGHVDRGCGWVKRTEVGGEEFGEGSAVESNGGKARAGGAAEYTGGEDDHYLAK